MRISDWSSDVCSSDLEALAHRFLEAEETEFLWDARDMERWIGAYESTEDEEIDLDRVRIFGRLDGKWFVAVMIVRSEEHTSELQSLMRISYAVFCLKKTN